MVSPVRQYTLLALLVAGCSAGAAAGNGTGRFVDAGSGTDSGKKADGGGTTTDLDADVDPTDASQSDASKNDAASTDASTTDSAASDSAATDSAVNDASPSDGGVTDAATDAPKDAPADTNDAGAICTIDDGTWVSTSTLAEYDIIAKGKLWAIDEDGVLLGSVALSSLPGMTSGPCAAQVGTCHIDAATWRDDVAEYHLVHGGKLWRLDINGTLLGSLDLTSFPGIAAGPCNGKTGAQCTFEAGAWRSDLQQYHLVVDGKIWAINKDGTSAGSSNLKDIPGVAAGPCSGAGTCHVDAFTYRPDKAEIHVIAKGNLYVMDTAGTLKSTTSLMAIPGMANGPCK